MVSSRSYFIHTHKDLAVFCLLIWFIQYYIGPLDEVTNIVRDPQTRITWEPPFSLNLTGMMIDVLYCILVINVTGGTEKPLFEHCNLTSPYFDDHSLCKGCLYEITVTPYSNGGGSLNGTPSTWRGMSMYLIFIDLS